MPQPWQRDSELNHLHPVFLDKVRSLTSRLSEENIPFRLFEGFRSPQRQQYLYEQGRTRPGSIVTKAKPWTSYHQYGLAGDFVLYENGNWSWDTSGNKQQRWDRLHEIGRELGLEPLSWELPHLQFSGLDISLLQSGEYPPGVNLEWAEWMEGTICSWSGQPPSPPVPSILPVRPSLSTVPTPDLAFSRALEGEEVISGGSSGWHSTHGGQKWRYDLEGVYLKGYEGGREPLRTPGEPTTCRTLWSLFHEEILSASQKFGIPPAILMMIIATETAFARRYGFTGPMTFRWEYHVLVEDVSPPIYGDYSAGPMQTLATTARWIIRQQRLEYDPFQIAPVFEERPDPPENLPLYDPAVSIRIGAAAVKHRWAKTGDDPILVAAAFNAGGLYATTANPWHLRTTGDHLDRAARWYGDACAVLQEARA